MSLTFYGIRHHGPGCARSLLAAWEAKPPMAVLIEGPPEANDLLRAVTAAGMEPPVALLLHHADNPRRAVFYPFAAFSPEWQALRWAVDHGVPVQFMDFPWTHGFALEEPEPDTDAAIEPSTVRDETEAHIRRDPLSVLAHADGYLDSERWWNDRVEERGDAGGMFEAIAEAMTAVREDLALPETDHDLRREAWMRRVIRQSQKETLGEVAVVCGAWHVPSLLNPPKVGEDNERLKGLPKAKVGVTWVPWTHERLCYANGYGAGIASPGWYEHLWHHRAGGETTMRWLTRVARILRAHDLDASTAQVIDTVRLAEHLAALRGRAIPGLDELSAAARSVFCQGDDAPLRWIQRELIVGQKLGQVPESLARVPLQMDLEDAQRRLRLKPSAAQTTVELDLRQPGGLARSQLLHRLLLLNIDWGRVAAHAGGKGTFKEVWSLEWKPDFAIAIIDAARFGNTVEHAAAGSVADRAREANLETLCALLEKTLLADLPAAAAALLQRLAHEAARADDTLRLARAVPALARLARYGNVRQTDAAAVERIIDGFCPRLHAGLAIGVAGIDDDAATAWRVALRDYHDALNLLESPWRDPWIAAMRHLTASDATHALLAGTCTRLLLDTGGLDEAQVAAVLSRALSRGEDPARAAAWLEGFLSDQGAVLIHDPRLLPLLEQWVATLTEDHFLAVLPLVRRTFATFTSPERARVAGLLGRASVSTPSGHAVTTVTTLDLNADRVAAVLPAVQHLLGLPPPAP